MPQNLDALMDAGGNAGWRDRLAGDLRVLWSRPYLLHGTATGPGGADVESRFHEAALGAVQLADYRNFAHGRHHWLAKRGRDTAVLAFVTPDDARVAERTLSLIPADAPVAVLQTPFGGLIAALASIVWSIFTAAAAGLARGIDPGRPGVPSFGRRLYNLSIRLPTSRSSNGSDRTIEAAVLRKLAVGRAAAEGTDAACATYAACAAFRTRLADAVFGGLVADHDGTLCSRSERGRKLREAVASELVRLARAGVIIGVATGRGWSVREELRRSLPKSLWQRVVVGYYNGSDAATLDDDTRPDRSDTCESASLVTLAAALKTDARFTDRCKITCRRHQVTLEPVAHSVSTLWSEVNDLAVRLGLAAVSVLRSGHSVDVVDDAASKRRVVEAVTARMTAPDLAVLCVGDRGRWPGNDYELLALPHSLSVDEVSTDPQTCWNFAPPGVRGVEAAMIYSKALRARAGRARLRLRLGGQHAT